MAQFEELIAGQIRNAGQKRVIGGVTFTVYSVDAYGYINEAIGSVLPVATSAGFAEGCWFTLTGGGVVTKTYENRGSNTSCNFIAVDAIGPASIALTTGNTLVGVAGVATDLNTLTVTTPALTVNTINLSGAATGNKPKVSAIGTDLNVGLDIVGKGTGQVGIGTVAGAGTGQILIGNGTDKQGASVQGNVTLTNANASTLVVGANGTTNPQLQIDTSVATVATGIKITGAAAAGGVDIAVISSGAAEDLRIASKGTGSVHIGQATSKCITLVADQPIADSSENNYISFVKTATAVNNVQVTNAATAGAPDVAAVGTDTNISLTLTPKGTGIVRAGTTGTVTAAAGAATLSTQNGIVTSEALSTAAGATYTLTLTNTKISAASVVMAQSTLGTATTGYPTVSKITPGAGSVVIVVTNESGAAALNGTILVTFNIIG